jgi:hypothetical protein
VIAAPLLDEQLAEDLRRLGAEHSIGISTLGIPLEELDDLPPHWMIPQMSEREFEALQEKLHPQRLSTTARNRPLLWRTLEQARRDNADFQALFAWLECCLKDSQAHTFKEFTTLAGEKIIRAS